MSNFFRLIDNTFTESIRQPIYFLMLLSAMGIILHLPHFAMFVFDEQLKLVVDSAMATSWFFGLLAAAICASSTVGREMRNGSTLLLFSKPVKRWSFILAKIVGVGLAIGLFTLVCNLGGIAALYVATDQYHLDYPVYYVSLGAVALACAVGMLANFFRGASFSGAASLALLVIFPLFCLGIYFVKGPMRDVDLLNILRAMSLVCMGGLIMSSIAVVIATKLESTGTIACCFFIFILGLLSNYFFARETGSVFLNAIFGFFYTLLPNWQYFWLADALAVGHHIPGSYLLNCALYLLFYLALISIWAVVLFNRREIADDSTGI